MIMISRIVKQIHTKYGWHKLKQNRKLAKTIDWLVNNPIIIKTKGIGWKQIVKSMFWNLT
jgi:uncharacterized protein (DUF2132 family)